MKQFTSKTKTLIFSSNQFSQDKDHVTMTAIIQGKEYYLEEYSSNKDKKQTNNSSIMTYHLTFPLETREIKLISTIKQQELYSMYLFLNQFEYQFLFNIDLKLPNHTLIPFKHQIENLMLFIQDKYKKKESTIITYLLTDSLQEINESILKPTKDFDTFLFVFREIIRRNEKLLTKALEVFELGDYQNITQLSNNSQYSDVIIMIKNQVIINHQYDENKEAKTKLIILLALYYCNFENNRFDSFLSEININDLNYLMEKILYFPGGFKKISLNLLNELIHIATKPYLIKNLLLQLDSGKKLLEIIYLNSEWLQKIYHKADKLNINQLININKTEPKEDLEYVIKNLLCFDNSMKRRYFYLIFTSSVLHKYINYALEVKNIDLITICITEYINVTRNNDNNMMCLKDMCNDAFDAISNSNKNGNSNDCYRLIKQSTILQLSPTKEALYFFKYNHNNDLTDNYDRFLQIDLEEIQRNDELLKLFQAISFDKIGGYINFIYGKGSPLKNMEIFPIIFMVIPLEAQVKDNDEVIKKIFLNILKENYFFNYSQLFFSFKRLLLLFNNNNTTIEFLQSIERILNINDIIWLYNRSTADSRINYHSLRISTKNSSIITHMKEFTMKEYQNDEPSGIIRYLKRQDDHLIPKLLQNLTDNVIRINDFFHNNQTHNLNLLGLLIKDDFFLNKDFQLSKYYLKTTEFIKSIKDVIEQDQYTVEQALTLSHSPDFLKNKINIISLNNAKEAKKLLKSVSNKITSLKETIEYIETLLFYHRTFFPLSHSNEISQLEHLLFNCNKVTVHNLITKYAKDLKQIEKQAIALKKFNNYYSMKIFTSLHNNYAKSLGEQQRLETSIMLFEEVVKLLKSNNANDINYGLISEFIFEIQNKDECELELQKVKVFFSIKKIKDVILNAINALIEKKIIVNYLTNVVLFINEFKPNKTGFIISIESYIDQLKSKLKEDQVQSIIQIIKSKNINITNQDDITQVVINLLLKQKELISFISVIEEEDICIIVKFISNTTEYNNEAEYLYALIYVYEFMNKIKVKEGVEDKTFFYNYLEICNDTSFILIPFHLKTVISNFEMIKRLINKIITSSQLQFTKQIKDILHSSYFQLILKEDKYIYTIRYGDIMQTITIDEIINIKDTIIAYLNKLNEEKDGDDQKKALNQIYNNFILCMKLVMHYLNLVNEIYSHEYSITFDQYIIIAEDKAFCTNEIKNTSAIELEIVNQEKTKAILEMKIEIQQAYLSEHLLTLFTFKQLKTIYNMGNSQEKVNMITNYMNYFTDNNYNQCSTYIINQIQNVTDMLEGIDNYLKDILKQNNLQEIDVYKQNIIKVSIKNRIYLHKISADNYEKETVHLYLSLTGNNPSAKTFLLCNELTTEEEITIFLYRSIKCPYNVLFYILNIELLELNIQKSVCVIISKLYGEVTNKDMKSTLMIAFTEHRLDFIIQLKQTNEVIEYQVDEKVQNKMKFNPSKIVIYSSKTSGMGKTQQIKEIASKTKYLYFELGGNLTKKDIVNRLLLLPIDNQTLIHLEITPTLQINVMRDVLFNFLVLNWFYFEEKIFYKCKNAEIFIEVSSDIDDIFDEYPFLKIFQKVEIDNDGLIPLLTSNIVLSNIQIVCNYLKYLKKNKIDSYNLFFFKSSANKETSKKNDETMKKAKVLPASECENLLKHYYKNYSNYHQLTLFVNLLAEQLKIFNNNSLIEAKQIKEIKDKRLRSLRSFILNNLIKNTIGFITQEAVSFDNIQSNFIIFNEDKKSLSMIFDEENKTNDDNLIILLVQTNYFTKKLKKMIELINCSQMTTNQYVEKLLIFFDLSIDDNNKLMVIKDLGSYAIVKDNYFKILLIMLRINARIPVILIGESGSGKTSLIKALSIIKHNTMFSFTIHKGICDNDIIDFMNNQVFKFKYPSNSIDDKLWVFFDEITTSDSIGLITEMMINRTMRGELIRPNIIFISACNNNELRQLPQSLLNYSLNFNLINEKDRIQYIKSIVEPPITKEYALEFPDLEIISNIPSIASELVCASHNYFCKLNKASSVSFRDVSNFSKVYSWLIQKIKEQRRLALVNRSFIQTEESMYYDKLQYEDIQKHSVILAIYICYYLKLSIIEHRTEYSSMVNTIFNRSNFDKIVNNELKRFIKKIEIPNNIAINDSLIHNIFALFVCISNRIPIFLCGKPGSSKSLSVKLLIQEIEMQKSKKGSFFENNSVNLHYYQFSQYSTSNQITQLINKAKENNKENVITIIVLDSLDCAVNIPNDNPIKVIHSEIENNSAIAFIGLFNDESTFLKINRGIIVNNIDLDENDLIKSTKEITSSYNDGNLNLFSPYFSRLAKAYFKYKMYLIYNDPKKKDFHSLWDYYNLIQSVCQSVIVKKPLSENKEKLERICLDAIEKHFDGFCNAVTHYQKIFKEEFQEFTSNLNYNCLQAVKNHLDSKTTCSITIIGKDSLNCFVIEELLSHNNYTIFIGSQFINDMNNENHHNQVIENLQAKYLEKKNEYLILQNIAIDPSYLNKKFPCIILINPMWIVNSMEKHILYINDLFKEDDYSKDLIEILQLLITPSDQSFNKTELDISKQLINCDINEIKALCHLYSKSNKNNNDIQMAIIDAIIPTLSQDIITYSLQSKLREVNKEMHSHIIKKYNKSSHINLSSFISFIHCSCNIIYTFTNIFDELQMINPINTSMFGMVYKESIDEEYVSNFNTEVQIREYFNDFYKSENKKICIFRFRQCDCIHLQHIKYLSEETNKCFIHLEKTKALIFIIHLRREFKGKIGVKAYQLNQNNLISNITNDTKAFIDNLNSCPITQINKHLTLSALVEMNNLFVITSLIDIKTELDTLLKQALQIIPNKATLYINCLTLPNIKEHLYKLVLNNLNEKSKVSSDFFSSIKSLESCMSFFEIIKYKSNQILIELIIEIILKANNDTAIINISNNINEKEKKAILYILDQYYSKLELDNSLKSFNITLRQINLPLIQSTYYHLSKTLLPFIQQYALFPKIENKDEVIKAAANELYKEQLLCLIELPISKEYINLFIQDYIQMFLYNSTIPAHGCLLLFITTILQNNSSKCNLFEEVTHQLLFLESNHDLFVYLSKILLDLYKDESLIVINTISEIKNSNIQIKEDRFEKATNIIMNSIIFEIELGDEKANKSCWDCFDDFCYFYELLSDIYFDFKNKYQLFYLIYSYVNEMKLSENDKYKTTKNCIKKLRESLSTTLLDQIRDILTYKSNSDIIASIIMNSIDIHNTTQRNEMINYLISNRILFSNKGKKLLKCMLNLSLFPNDDLFKDTLSVKSELFKKILVDPYIIELFMIIFEEAIQTYFISLDKEEQLLGNNTKRYLHMSLQLIFPENHQQIVELPVLYSISFLKIYLSHFIPFAMVNTTDCKEIITILLGDSQSKRLLVQYYFEKIALNELKSYQSFLAYNMKNLQIQWNFDKNDLERYPLNYLFIDLHKYNEHITMNNWFIEIDRGEGFSIYYEIFDLLDKSNYGIETFIDCSINHCYAFVLSDSSSSTMSKYINYDSFMESFKNNLNTPCIQEIISLFNYTFKNPVVKALISNDSELEMVLYLYKLVMIILMKKSPEIKDNFVYFELSSKLQSSLLEEINKTFRFEDTTILKYDHISFRVLILGLFAFELFNQIINSSNLTTDSLKPLFNLLVVNWNILKRLLIKKKINNIQIFFNMLLSQKSSLNYTYFLTVPSKELTFLVSNLISEYQDYEIEFKDKNYSLLHRNTKTIRSILCELEPPNQSEGLEKYFMLTTYPSESVINKTMQFSEYQSRYPLIFLYLNKETELKRLLLVKTILNITNTVYSLYLKSETNFTESKVNFDNFLTETKEKEFFLKTMNEIILEIYKKNIDITLLSFWLLEEDKQDDMRPLFQYFIKLQNDLLQPILENKKDKFPIIVKFCSEKIGILKANKAEILTHDFRDNNNPYDSFNELLYNSFTRSCFLNNKLTYMHYDEIEYDYDKIEEEMAKYFLRGRRLLSGDLIYVRNKLDLKNNYKSIVNAFELKFPQRLIEETKQSIIKNKLSQMKEIEWSYDNFILLLNYIIEERSFSSHTLICKAFSEWNINPSYIKNKKKFAESCLSIDITYLIHFYDLVEEEMILVQCQDLNNKYKRAIPKDLHNSIMDYYYNQNPITQREILKIIRRFMLRYLLPLKPDEAINNKELLFVAMKSKIPLWYNDNETNRIDNILTEMHNSFMPNIENIYSVYTCMTSSYDNTGDKTSKKKRKY